MTLNALVSTQKRPIFTLVAVTPRMPPLFTPGAAERSDCSPPADAPLIALPVLPALPPVLPPPLGPVAADDAEPGVVTASTPEVAPPGSPAAAAPEPPLCARSPVLRLLSCR